LPGELARRGGILRRGILFDEGAMMRISAALSLTTLSLSACVTPQMHTESQLNAIATGCGLALGELIQDESEKKLVLMIHQDPDTGQRICIAKWARRNGLKAVFVNMQFPEEPAT
jgi:hypothetical protein